MKTVALISGGKDSCYNMVQCVAERHDIVALANLKPKDKDELDSYMYQSVGHHAIDLYAEAMGLPLYRREIQGTSMATDRDYTHTAQDEVEDLYELLKLVKDEMDVEAVAVGAILSNYQRVRVEHVCGRLGLTPLAYLWRRDQTKLLDEMIQCGIHAILIKVAAMGLEPKSHLGKSLSDMQAYLQKKSAEFDLNVCGEGGEFETFTLDCPLFRKKIVLDETELVLHSDDPIAPVGYLNLRKAHLEDKNMDVGASQRDLVVGLPMKQSSLLLQELFGEEELLSCEQCARLQREQHTDTAKALTPRVYHRDKHVWISGLTGVCEAGGDVHQVTRATLDQLQALLEGCGPGWDMSCLVLVHLYVSNMADFAAINSVYRTYFSLNPAARVCVQAVLPCNIALQLDCYGYCNHGDRDTMHVQGLSHWAPANIGPYSQCVRISSQLYVAGQIGMVPANLSVVAGGARPESRLSLRHVDRVLAAMAPNGSTGNISSCICYVTHGSYITVAKEEFRRIKTEGVPCECVYVVVPSLPKAALVEWQVTASSRAHGEYTEFTVARSDQGMECSMRCVCAVLQAEEGEGTQTSLCSLTGTVVLIDTGSISTLPAIDNLTSLLYECHQLVANKAGLTLDTLPLTRVFYPGTRLDFNAVNTALEQSYAGLPFSAVPVLQLERDDILIAVCQ